MKSCAFFIGVACLMTCVVGAPKVATSTGNGAKAIDMTKEELTSLLETTMRATGPPVAQTEAALLDYLLENNHADIFREIQMLYNGAEYTANDLLLAAIDAAAPAQNLGEVAIIYQKVLSDTANVFVGVQAQILSVIANAALDTKPVEDSFFNMNQQVSNITAAYAALVRVIISDSTGHK